VSGELLLWLKSLHIIAFSAWMAGMWYLPRLMVYHADAAVGSEVSQQFKIMERRLLRAIINPAMFATLGLGIWLATGLQVWSAGWLHGKLALVLAMTACHGVLARNVRAFANDLRPHSAKWYRVLNEVPTLLFIGIVCLAVIKPF